MDPLSIRTKFGDDYTATERTHRLGIDVRITQKIALRFEGRTVLESCTGAGFTTISLARVARHVITIEIDPDHQEQARENLAKATLLDRVTMIAGDCLSDSVLREAGAIDAAFLDPDWAVTGPHHVFRFRQSNTRPPADALLERVLSKTTNVALILPPSLNRSELDGLPPHEFQSIYLGQTRALYCLYFGALATGLANSELYA